MTTINDIIVALPSLKVVGDGATSISGITHDSRQVEPGFIFAALPGAVTDGRKFVDSALKKGAVAILSNETYPLSVPQILTDDPRTMLGPVSAAVYAQPTKELVLTGITGTNGKTTISYLAEAALIGAGAAPGVMGTVDYRFLDNIWKADHTTPEASTIQSVARKMVDAGASHLIMEVSSHGLALGRLGGCNFDVVAFSNLTQDHLDFHYDMERYAAAKMLLFTEALRDNPRAKAVINTDDPFSQKILKEIQRLAITVSCNPESEADLRPTKAVHFGVEGIFTSIHTPLGIYDLNSPLIGLHNLNNLLVALGICVQTGVDLNEALKGLAEFQAVPGRLEQIPCPHGFTVLVDYAHTPDALKRVLTAIREITDGRLICVFGCGGDRDHAKRPLMGEAVARAADLAIVTSDNPRTEIPEDIVKMILPGITKCKAIKTDLSDLSGAGKKYAVIIDRASAIKAAILEARPGDTVLIAGKGHEDYQIIGTSKIHFDDREQAQGAIATRKIGANHV